MTKTAATAAFAAALTLAAAPGFAADDAGPTLESRISALLAASQQSLAQKLEAKAPVTFAFIGNRVVPVFLHAAKARYAALDNPAVVTR